MVALMTAQSTDLAWPAGRPIVQTPSPAQSARRRPSASVIRRRRLFALVVAGAFVVMAARAGAALGSSSLGASEQRPPSAHVTQYVVQPGDTLWSIAKQLAPNKDPRQIVDAISHARGTKTPLQPGETILWQR